MRAFTAPLRERHLPDGAMHRPQAASSTANVVVDLLIPELEVAYCRDQQGRQYVIDRRSAVSLSALAEGLPLHVRVTDAGLVKGLVLEN
jgi:hypothetical protein